jgi:hypothetical protein
MTRQQLQERAAARALFPEDLVWQEGTPAWMPARKVPGLLAESAAPPRPTAAAQPFVALSQAADKVKDGPHPAGGTNVHALIDQLMAPGERFDYGITGELANSWTKPTMVAALTNRRLLIIQKRALRLFSDAAKEWTAYPLSAVSVSYQSYLLSSTVTITTTNGDVFKLDKIPKSAAPRFEDRFLALRDSERAGEPGNTSAEDSEAEAKFIKGYREGAAELLAKGLVTEEQVTEAGRAAYRSYVGGVRQAVSEGIADAFQERKKNR